MKTLKLSLITLSFLVLSACGSGSDDPDESAPQGVFIDSAVEGVTFITATQSGTTDSAGTFTYIPGEVVSFYIGDILIGSAEGQDMLTPLDFVPGAVDETDPQVTNILRFVQSLDSDNNPDNGITISAATAAAAIGQNLDFSAANINFVADAEALLTLLTAGAVNTLIDASTAQAHFVASIGGTVTTASAGILTLAGTDTGLFGTSLDADPTLTVVTPLGVDSAVVQWRQNLAGGAFLEVAVTYFSGVIYDVLFTWQDGGSVAAYAISCPANPLPSYTVGDCSLMALDLTTQQVTFDVSIFVEPIFNIDGTAPITVNGVLNF